MMWSGGRERVGGCINCHFCDDFVETHLVLISVTDADTKNKGIVHFLTCAL